MSVFGGLEGHRYRAGATHRNRHIAAGRGDGGEGSECLTGCTRTIVVDPGLFEHAHPVRSRRVRLAGLPEAKCGGLGHAWVRASHVDHERIGGYLNVGDEADTASMLDK
jgi:hypothetical protein